MFLFIVGLLLLAAAVGILIFRKQHHASITASNAALEKEIRGTYRAPKPREAVPFLGWGAGLVAVLGVLAIFFSVFYQVGTKEDGILTSYGKTVGHVGSGPHLKAPWQQVHEMDAAIQTDTFEDNSSNDTCAGIPVRLAFQQTGCASVSIQWRIKEAATDELYRDFRSFDHVRNALVTRKLQLAANEAFANYNPLNIAEGQTTKSETLPEIGKNIQRIMAREVGKQITVLSVLVPLVTYDPQTQSRINQLQQQVAQTRIANQERLTNIAKSKANDALSRSVNTSPNVLVSRCLDILESMVKNSQAVPAGFSCWPGSGVAGVIANTGK